MLLPKHCAKNRRLAPVLASLAVVLGAGVAWGAESAVTSSAPVRIGLVGSLFTDIPTAVVEQAAIPKFAGLMKEVAGLDGQAVLGGTALQLAHDLAAGKVQLAVFHGVEFGRAQQRHPELRPLVVAINKRLRLQAHVVVRKDATATRFADLRGAELALPKQSKEHCRLFLDRRSLQSGVKSPSEFFSRVVAPVSVEAALDDLCRGTIPAAVVDAAALEWYRDLKPGCFARLKVIESSESFPAGVIAYCHGAVAASVLQKFRGDLLSAHKSVRGRTMMGLFKITSFEPVPNDYAHVVSSIVKAYPAPGQK